MDEAVPEPLSNPPPREGGKVKLIDRHPLLRSVRQRPGSDQALPERRKFSNNTK